ncbi:MAG: hypothetical protein KC449_25295, partial [Anaerolineales bacterium]|nr:hypothetical protein [Anaerolineales bacterium]
MANVKSGQESDFCVLLWIFFTNVHIFLTGFHYNQPRLVNVRTRRQFAMEEQTRSVTRENDSRFVRLRTRVKGWLQRGWPFAAGIVAAFLGILLYSNLYPDPLPLSDDQVDQIVV